MSAQQLLRMLRFLSQYEQQDNGSDGSDGGDDSKTSAAAAVAAPDLTEIKVRMFSNLHSQDSVYFCHCDNTHAGILILICKF
jgi:hypothetical protein